MLKKPFKKQRSDSLSCVGESTFKVSTLKSGKALHIKPEEIVILILKAQNGDAACLNSLIEQIRPKLELCVNQMTMDYHETQDVLQESLTKMVMHLNKLKDADRFWPWLRRIAFNSLMDFRKKEGRQRDLSQKLYNGTRNEEAKGLSNLIRDEFSKTVFKSLYQLKDDHRHILVLRCYQEMSFCEISDFMDRSEFGARMLFRRAIRSLQKKLTKNGLTGLFLR